MSREPDPIEGSWGERILTYWADRCREEYGNLPMAVPDRIFRASWAGKCTRALQYEMTFQPPTEPFDDSTQWTFMLGHKVHEEVQAALVELMGDTASVQLEYAVDLEPLGIPGAATADMVVTSGDEVGLVEIKSMNGVGFRIASTEQYRRSGNQPPAGPRDSAVRQAALAGAALEADWIVVLVLALERNTKAEGLAQVVAEWTYHRAEYLPIAENEVARVKSVVKAIDEKRLIRRHSPEMPKGAEIIDPPSSAWMLWTSDGEPERAGNLWNGKYCDYCSFRTRCVEDGREGTLVDVRQSSSSPATG